MNSNPVLRHFSLATTIGLADSFQNSLMKDIDMIKDIAGKANWTILFHLTYKFRCDMG